MHANADEFIGAWVVDVVLKPWQPEAVHTEAHQVHQRFDVVDRVCASILTKLSNRAKHRVAFEGGYGVTAFYALGEGEINKVILAVVEADVVQLDVPVAKADLMQLLEGIQHLHCHFGNFDSE